MVKLSRIEPGTAAALFYENPRNEVIMPLKTKKTETNTFPEPPAHLSQAAQALWAEYGPLRAKHAARRVMLQAALECLDTIAECRATIAQEGLFEGSVGKMRHTHPAVRLERAAREEWWRLWRALGLSHAVIANPEVK